MKPLAESHFSNSVPAWVPTAARHYLQHTEAGVTIRQLARVSGCHASTVLRQIRKFETRRDDPLIDAALKDLGQAHFQPSRKMNAKITNGNGIKMTQDLPKTDPDFAQDAQRILRRLCESDAFLVVADGMEKAVVMREAGNGQSLRTAVVNASVAQAMALREWIVCKARGRVAKYQITAAGRIALSEITGDEGEPNGFAEDQASFDMDGQGRRPRYGLGDSPLMAFARRKGANGQPFLANDLVRAGERLREDFELAHMSARETQNWQGFLAHVRSEPSSDDPHVRRIDARKRVQEALVDLGPGLAEVAVACCCFLEGIETVERRMGWSARSGKIVLRIALQRLRRHYTDQSQRGGDLIG